MKALKQALLLVSLALAGCASVPDEPVREVLDPNTGTTITRLGQPVEFIAEATRTRGDDPFAYAAPFEVNRMGARRTYLWLSVPGPIAAPHFLCEGRAVALTRHRESAEVIGISRPVYSSPAPWAEDGVFEISAELLTCLGRDKAPALLLSAAPEDEFSSATDRSADWRAFDARVSP